MNRPRLTVSQFDASFEYASLVGGGFIVEFVSFLEGCGENFRVQAIIFVDPRPKFRGIGDDLFVFLLVDRQYYGTLFTWGGGVAVPVAILHLLVPLKTRRIMAFF